MHAALTIIVLSWCKKRRQFSTQALSHLLNLVGELRVKSVVIPLKRKVAQRRFAHIRPRYIRSLILSTIASNAEKGDDAMRAFWERVATRYPRYAGMAFQVLSKVDRESALQILERFPNCQVAACGVARGIGAFITSHRSKRRRRLSTRIINALDT